MVYRLEGWCPVIHLTTAPTTETGNTESWGRQFSSLFLFCRLIQFENRFAADRKSKSTNVNVFISMNADVVFSSFSPCFSPAGILVGASYTISTLLNRLIIHFYPVSCSMCESDLCVAHL